ncbi:MAG TPA: DinB family protein [Pyrinomonadaceae bacterium]|jgi:hypothetical protein
MRYESIADIFSANAKIREALEIVLGGISPQEAAVRSDDCGWNINEIVEHISIVEGRAGDICIRLVDKAREDNLPADGSFKMSENLVTAQETAANTKIQAPERVQPTGGISMTDALAKLVELRKPLDVLQPDMERLDLSAHKFPHPVFGEMTAPEWMLVLGGHEMRHTLQIQRVLEQIRR